NMAEQISFGPLPDEVAINREPRCPVILLLDVSASMKGKPITALNDGLVTFKDEMMADSLACKRVEVAVVTFGSSVETICPFTTAEQFQPPVLSENGDTPMGAAILLAIDMLRDRKDWYKAYGLSYYRPWIFLITDGGPTDEWASAAVKVKQGEDKKSFA